VIVAACGPPEPGRCAVVTGAGLCLVKAADPARSGGPAAPRAQIRKRTPPRSGSPVAPAPAEPLVATPIIGGGWRVGALPQLPGAPGRPPAKVAAPDPGVLARWAVELLRLPRPSVQASATDRAYVGVPVWLWIEGGQPNVGPVSATATAGAARVTATARLTRTVWAMGPPGAVVDCPGPGTPWTGQRGPSPDCGYVYSTRSLPERTGGTGRWTVTVTGVWAVTWNGISGGAPVAGEQVVQLAAARPLDVGELQVLVTGGES
jgi:hypothetical protein